MKVSIINIENKEIGKKELPSQFNEDVRPDMIKRAVLSVQNSKRQAYGAYEHAGKRASVEVSKRRKDYRGCYGLGISRAPRKILSRMGTRMNWVGAFAPGTVGGRKAHPPKANRVWEQKINKKERRKAIRSAISATILNNMITDRGHILPESFPFIISREFEDIEKTKKVAEALEKIGFGKELKRAAIKQVRAGKGKTRGRKYKKKAGPLIVVSKKCKLMQSARNMPGIKIAEVKSINAELLAPGTFPGRLTLWTDSAIELLEKERLFY